MTTGAYVVRARPILWGITTRMRLQVSPPFPGVSRAQVRAESCADKSAILSP